MTLLDSFDKNGQRLFKYRGQIPILIFLLAIPMILFSNKIAYFHIAIGRIDTVFITVITIIAILVSLSGFLIRAYTIGTTPTGTSGRNTDKQVASQLNTTGIYSVVRHPLYLGNYLMWAGLLIFSMNIYLFIIVSLVYWLYYERIMFTEERYLASQFGDDFNEWASVVPAFIPKIKLFKNSAIPFSLRTVLRREYSGFFAIIAAYTVVDYLMQIAIYHTVGFNYPFATQWLRPSLVVTLFALVLMITLRSLKHHSKLLEPVENRD